MINLARILELIKENPRGLNIHEIATLVGINRTAAAKYLDVLTAQGKIEVRVMGKARLFYLAQVPVLPSVLDFIPSGSWS